MRTVTLESIPFKAVHSCFVRAFADYTVDIASVTESALLRRANKNNWVPRLSAGMVEGNELVAITMVGVDRIRGEWLAYDICTGITPSFRGRGLAGSMIGELEPKLVDTGINALQLEVLQTNEAAIKAYKKAGFTVNRGLCSFSGIADSVKGRSDTFQIERAGLSDLLALSPALDFTPSFEQRDQAIEHLDGDLIVIGARTRDRLISAIAYDPQTNWLMRLVTHRDFRRRGAASALLRGLARQLDDGTPIKAINIDADDIATASLMRSCGLEGSRGQWEMLRRL